MTIDADLTFLRVINFDHVIFRQPLCPVIVAILAFQEKMDLWHEVFLITRSDWSILSVSVPSSCLLENCLREPFVIILWHVDALNSTIELDVGICKTPQIFIIIAELDACNLCFPVH